MVKICDKGCENLVAGIIKQAVDDYVKAKHELHWLNDTDRAIIKVIKTDSKNNPSIKTLEEAFVALERKVIKNEALLEESRRFFKSDFYKSMTDIDGEYMLAQAQKRYEDEAEERRKKAEEEKAKKEEERRKKKEEVED